MNLKTAALCAAIACGSAVPAHAQYISGAPLFSPQGMIGSISQMYSRVVGNGYGYRGGYRRPPPGWCPPGQQQAIRLVRHVEERPFTSGSQYRCFADGRPSGGPGTGTGWCKR